MEARDLPRRGRTLQKSLNDALEAQAIEKDKYRASCPEFVIFTFSLLSSLVLSLPIPLFPSLSSFFYPFLLLYICGASERQKPGGLGNGIPWEEVNMFVEYLESPGIGGEMQERLRETEGKTKVTIRTAKHRRSEKMGIKGILGFYCTKGLPGGNPARGWEFCIFFHDNNTHMGPLSKLPPGIHMAVAARCC
jgi:hypothetical protein